MLVSSENRYLMLAVVAIAALIIILFSVHVSPAHGHSPERPDLNGWFSSLESVGKAPCCEGSDAAVLKDADWESRDGRYRVRIEGQWWDVPDEAVVTGPNKFGRTLVWPTYYYSYPSDDRTGKTGLDRIVIRCFMPGSMI